MFHAIHHRLWSQYNTALWTDVMLSNGFELPEINVNAVTLIAKSEVINWTDFNELTSDMEPIHSGRLRRRLQNTGLVHNTGIKGGFTCKPSDALTELVGIIEAFSRDNVTDVVRACDRLATGLEPFDPSFTIISGNCQDDLTVTEPSKGLSVTECLFYGALLILWLVLTYTGIDTAWLMFSGLICPFYDLTPLANVTDENMEKAARTRLRCAQTLSQGTDSCTDSLRAAVVTAACTMRRATRRVADDMMHTLNALKGQGRVNEMQNRASVLAFIGKEQPVTYFNQSSVFEDAWASLYRVDDSYGSEFDAVEDLTDIPGIGAAKSSFAVQMLSPASDTVCIDVRNLGTLKAERCKKFLRKAKTYNILCMDMGYQWRMNRYGESCRKHGGFFSDAMWALWVSGLASQHDLTVDYVNDLHVEWCKIGCDITNEIISNHTDETVLKRVRKDFWLR